MAQWVKIAATASLPDGRGVRIEAGSHCIAVFRIGGDVLAVGDRCSHAEASLSEGELFDFEIECRCTIFGFDGVGNTCIERCGRGRRCRLSTVQLDPTDGQRSQNHQCNHDSALVHG